MQIACVLITHLPVKVELGRHARLRGKPVIITTGSGRGPLVLDSSPEAGGVIGGMPLQEALAHCKGAVLMEADVPYYRAVFDGIVDSLARRSPLVEEAELGCAYVGVGGLETIYGDQAGIIISLLNAVPQQYNPRIGLAKTKFPAYVAAVLGDGGRATIVPDDVPRFLEGISVDLLPMSWENRMRLHGFGLHTMGQLASLSLGSLQAQFGAEGRLAWELANGIDRNRLMALKREVVVSESLTFPSPAATLHAILPTIGMLLGRAFTHPSIRGRHVRAVSLEGKVPHKPPWTKQLAFKNPVSSKEKALSILKDSLETAKLPGPLEEIRLTLAGVVGESGIQSSLFSQVRKQEQLREMMRQLEARLCTKPPIYKVMDMEPWSRIPERRQALVQFEP